MLPFCLGIQTAYHWLILLVRLLTCWAKDCLANKTQILMSEEDLEVAVHSSGTACIWTEQNNISNWQG